jgi:hypothetical protein
MTITISFERLKQGAVLQLATLETLDRSHQRREASAPRRWPGYAPPTPAREPRFNGSPSDAPGRVFVTPAFKLSTPQELTDSLRADAEHLGCLLR